MLELFWKQAYMSVRKTLFSFNPEKHGISILRPYERREEEAFEVPWWLQVCDLIGVCNNAPSLIHKESGGFQ